MVGEGPKPFFDYWASWDRCGASSNKVRRGLTGVGERVNFWWLCLGKLDREFSAGFMENEDERVRQGVKLKRGTWICCSKALENERE